MSETKILVGSPVHQSKEYCLKQFINVLNSLTYPCDVYLSDNSPDKGFSRYIQRTYGFECGHVDRETDNIMEGIALSQNQIRERLLFGGYTHLLSLEMDIVPPTNCIELLLSFEKDVVSLPYLIGTGARSTLCLMGLEEWGYGAQNRLVPFEESLYLFNGKLIETKGAGLGCTLIHRSILERIEFGFIERKKHIPSDTYFYMDLQRMGVTPYLATGFGLCHHNNQEWKLPRQ